MELRYLVVLLLALSATPLQASGVADTHYVAAVVEYATPSLTGLPAEQNYLNNVKAYAGFMAQAAEKGADIIVFPEIGLKGFGNQDWRLKVPGPEEKANPCSAGEPQQVLRELSCLAKQHNMYLVVNLAHQQDCSRAQDARCPARGFYSYNTNVVFDRRGQIVARYHKYNLFGEYSNNVPPAPEQSFFDTDFGVRFGTFICFDILFDKPAVELIRSHNVTDVAFSTAWFSEVPFLTATQAHSGWAHALDVTVLSAGLNGPAQGAGGSGLYRGRHGILDAVFDAESRSRLIVGRVPKRGHWDDAVYRGMERLDAALNYRTGTDPFDEMDPLFMIQDNMTLYAWKPLARPGQDETVRANNEELCHYGLCCRFSVEARGTSLYQMNSAALGTHSGFSWSRARSSAVPEATQPDDFDGFHYRMVVFSGVRDHSHVATTGVQVCGLISCLGDDWRTCGWQARGLGSPLIKWTEILSVHIEGEYEQSGTLQFASTQAGPRYEPLPASVYTFESTATSTVNKRVSLSMQQPLLDLRTFAIYGRYFAWDGRPATGY